MAVETRRWRTNEEVLAEQLLDDEFRREWERTALARVVAARLIAYRADHGITQSELATRLGLRQPNVARLEAADHNPSLETLARIAGLLKVELTVSVAPGTRAPRQLTSAAREQVEETYRLGDATIRFAATE